MSRTFKPEEFVFDPYELQTPVGFLQTLNRMDPKRINTPGYAIQLHQTVTNQNNFDNDAWVDLCMDIGFRAELTTFTQALGQWQTRYEPKQSFLPDILEDAYNNSVKTGGWVHTLVDNAGITPASTTPASPSVQAPAKNDTPSFDM